MSVKKEELEGVLCNRATGSASQTESDCSSGLISPLASPSDELGPLWCEAYAEQSGGHLARTSIFDVDYAREIPAWSTMYQLKATDYCKALCKKCKALDDPDLRVQVGRFWFNCHKAVLQIFSTYFAERWNLDEVVVLESEILSNVFVVIYQWMLENEICCPPDFLIDSYISVKFLGVSLLLCDVSAYIDDDLTFNEHTAFMLFKEARSRGVENVVALLLPRISKFFLTLVSSRDFLDLNIDDLCTILSSSTISVNTEAEVFMSGVRWLESDWKQRRLQMVRVMKCVRFNLLPVAFNVLLSRLVPVKEEGVLAQVASNNVIKLWIKNSMAFTTIHALHSKDPKTFLQNLAEFEVTVPKPRMFIYDPLASYHCDLESTSTINVDYIDFCMYLRALRAKDPGYFENLKTYDASNEGPKLEH